MTKRAAKWFKTKNVASRTDNASSTSDDNDLRLLKGGGGRRVTIFGS